MSQEIVQLNQGLSTAFINHNISSNLAYKPQFVSNNYKEGRKVISSIEDELLSCEEFAISVAFITMGGITVMLPEQNPVQAISTLISLNQNHGLLAKKIKVIDMRDDARILVK